MTNITNLIIKLGANFSFVFISILLIAIPSEIYGQNCEISYSTSDGNITITGLTQDANSKLFDSNFNSVWECNPWNNNLCGNNETISGITNGATYYLSIQSNNCDEWIPIVVNDGNSSQSLPDLEVEFLQPIAGQSGTVVDFQFTLINSGNADAANNFTIQTYISTDNFLSPNDIPEGIIMTGFMQYNSTVEVTGAITIPENLAAGNYFLIMKVDDLDQIVESNENNNLANTELTVGSTNGGCNVSLTSQDGEMTITGLTSIENSKLFDENYNIVWSCNPWNGSPCSGTESISELTVGANYFFSTQSDVCDEWISITIEGGDSSPCGATLENYNGGCLDINEDGSFSSFDFIAPNHIQNNYSSNGEFLGSNISVINSQSLYVSSNSAIQGTDDTGTSVNINIDPAIVSTYTTGINKLESKVIQAANGDFYIVGMQVFETTPGPAIGYSFFDLEFYVHRLDSNGNEVSAYVFSVVTMAFEDINYIGNRANIFGMSLLVDDKLELFVEINYQIGPGNLSVLEKTYRYRIDPNLQSQTTATFGLRDTNGTDRTLSFSGPSRCGYARYLTSSNSSTNSGFTINSYEEERYDYNVSPPELVFKKVNSNTNGPGGQYSQAYIQAKLSDGKKLNVSTVENQNGKYNYSVIVPSPFEVILSGEINVIPQFVIPTGGNNFNYIFDGLIYNGDCEGPACNDADADGICDEDDCAPNDATLPTTTGSTCDDFDATTTNDVIQSDMCTCAGTPTNGECNVSIQETGVGQVTITGLSTTENTKLFDSSANSSGIVWECNPWSTNCSNTEIVDGLIPGAQYYLSVQSDNCSEWIPYELNMASFGNNSQLNEVNTSDKFSIVKVFPNPVSNEAFVKIESTFDGEMTFEIYDVIGQRQATNLTSIENGINTIELNINNLNAGIYHLFVRDDKGQTKSLRFVKIRD